MKLVECFDGLEVLVGLVRSCELLAVVVTVESIHGAKKLCWNIKHNKFIQLITRVLKGKLMS